MEYIDVADVWPAEWHGIRMLRSVMLYNPVHVISSPTIPLDAQFVYCLCYWLTKQKLERIKSLSISLTVYFSYVCFYFFVSSDFIITALYFTSYNSRQRSLNTLHFLYSAMNFHPPLPLKQCWFLGEVHAIMGKFRVHANFKCSTNEPTLF